MRRKREVYLSAFVSEETRLQGKALNLQAKGITTLDEISPFLCSETESLNLHNNKLTTLKNIEQFNFLRELDISSNKISSCSELTRLKDMFQLKKLYVSNNPFLNDPLDESILDFILERETDIEILSYELLNTIKEVGEEEMKIIFLKNYLNKIEIHEELKQKEYVRQSRPKAKTEALLDKIIPQFYTIIEDPRMAHAIKKEALDIKRKKNATMESALQSTKNNKVTKINQLIGDIVSLLHENRSFRQSRNFLLQVNFNDNTISFSPERNKDFNNTIKMDQQQFSPVKYIELSKDENTFEELSLTNTRNLKQTISAMKEKQSTQQKSFNSDAIQTSRKPSVSPSNPSKSPLNDKLKHFSDFKQNYQTELKKIKQRKQMESKRSKQSAVRKVEPVIPSKSFTPAKSTKPSIKIKTPGDTARSQYIKVIEQNEQESSSFPREQQQIPKSPIMVSPKNFHDSSISMRTAVYNYGQSISPQAIETIYFKTLTKINPMFSLLFSPANSLNNEEKNTILEALKIDHKEKFIELFKEKIANQNLLKELEQAKQQLGTKLEEAVDNNRGVFAENQRLKEEFAWIDERHKNLQSQYNKIYNRMKQSEARQKNKATAMTIMQTSYKKIKDSYKDKADQLTLLTQSEDIEETIREKHENNLKMVYLKKLKEKAAKWKFIFAQIAKSKAKLEKELKEIGVEAFASNRKYQKSIKAYTNKYDKITLQKHFSLWAVQKQNEKKYKKLNKYLRQKESNDFISLLKKNQANRKMKKLKQIWADRFFKQKRYTASFDKLDKTRIQGKANRQKAISYQKLKVLNRYVKAIKELIATRKRHIEAISQKHINIRGKSQFIRMVNIMKKDHFELLEKSHKARLLHQKYQKSQGISKLRIEGSFLKQEKQKRKDLVKYLKKKNLKFMRKSHKKTLKLLKKLKKTSISLKSGMIGEYLKREKKSNDYNKIIVNSRLQQFCNNLKYLRATRQSTRDKQRKLQTYLQHKLLMNKMRLLRKMQVGRLKGKNYVKHRTIQEMNMQMDLNDQTAIDIVRTSKEQMLRLQRDINFLKQQIQTQSLREMVLMREKDEIMLNIGESCEVMEEMKREIAKLSAEYAQQLQRYDQLAIKYNNAMNLLEKKQMDCEWLYDSLRDHKLP